MRNAFLFWCIGLLLTACEPIDEKEKATVRVDLDNAVVQQIFNFQNARNTNAILPFLSVENPSHRYVAAMSLASVQDTAAIKDLSDLLNDDYEEIRYAATYALGQIGHIKAASYLTEAFQKDTSRLVQSGILEAIGKCGNQEHLKYISVTRPYPVKDSLLHEGQAQAIYNFALRGLVHQEGTTKIMNDFMANSLISPKARFIAANYLARTAGIDLSGYENVLINNVTEEKNPDILMFTVSALAKSKTTRARKTLLKEFANQADYRVRCNIIRGLQYFPYDTVKYLALEALNAPNIATQITAAEYLYQQGSDVDAAQFFGLAENHENWRVRSLLYAAAIKNTIYFKSKTKSFYSQKVIAQYKKTSNASEKGALLKALGNYSWNYRFLSKVLFGGPDSLKLPEIVYSSAAEALVTLRKNPVFKKELGISNLRIAGELNEIFKNCIVEGDAAVQAIAASFMTEKTVDFKKVFSDVKFMEEAQSKLSLPSNIETYIILDKALDFLLDRASTSRVQSSNPTEIDWPLIKALKGKYKIKLNTNKGTIALKLFPEAAPATVTQFIHLAKAKYYDNKAFHRVVPNFVLQGGCSRGDGWSGFDVTIPSEFHASLKYQSEGWVGMASAGKDTESAQFFITHAPTIHLDGRYSIFAKVIEGFDVIHKIEVGDRINSVEID